MEWRTARSLPTPVGIATGGAREVATAVARGVVPALATAVAKGVATTLATAVAKEVVRTVATAVARGVVTTLVTVVAKEVAQIPVTAVAEIPARGDAREPVPEVAKQYAATNIVVLSLRRGVIRIKPSFESQSLNAVVFERKMMGKAPTQAVPSLEKAKPKRQSLTLILTHRCNLNCTYCYERFKSNVTMPFEIARQKIEEAFQRVSDSPDADELEINFFGGEPFLEFELIKRIAEWVWSVKRPVPYILSASTNGSLVDETVKKWLLVHKRSFVPILSYDGGLNQDKNRSNSLKAIDLEFFRDNYPQQRFKMTASPETVDCLAKDVAQAHQDGFPIEMSYAYGVDWNNEQIATYRRELAKLSQFYLDNPGVQPVMPFSRSLTQALNSGEPQKFCGCGDKMYVFDVDGTRYPCQLCTPLVLEPPKIKQLLEIKDFTQKEVFFDDRCEKCSYRHLCKTCYGHNTLETGCFSRKLAKYCRLNQVEIQACMKYKAALFKSKIDAGVPLTQEEIRESKAILHLSANPPLTLDDATLSPRQS